jgi:hypothetical protein
VAKPSLPLRPALIARATQPLIELVLDRPLDDQPGAEPSQLGQHLRRVINQPLRQQLVDLDLYLRRRRYGASHGVGLLHRLAGLEGTYAVALTAPARLFTAVLGRDRRVGRDPLFLLARASDGGMTSRLPVYPKASAAVPVTARRSLSICELRNRLRIGAPRRLLTKGKQSLSTTS